MKTLSIFGLFLSMGLHVWAANPYVGPFYNNEEIPLPSWVKEELHDINSRLRDKLSPSDYLEILKGEYYLMGEFKTKAQYQRAEKDVAYPLKDITNLKTKLEQIYQNPEDRHIFSRAEILPISTPGVYYRDSLRYSDAKVLHVQSHYVLTKSQGLGEDLSNLWTLWDSRTDRILSQFAIPQHVRFQGCKTLADGNPVYFAISYYGEHAAHSWADNGLYAAYIWSPLHHIFQQLQAVYDYGQRYIRTYSQQKQGDLWKRCDFVHEVNEDEFPPGSDWTIEENPNCKDLGIKQGASYVATIQQQDGSILFLKTSDKNGQEIDNTTPAEKLRLSDLSRRSITFDDTTKKQRSEQLKQKLVKILNQDRQFIFYFYYRSSTSLDEASFIFGEECKGWIPFVIATLQTNEGTGNGVNLMGLISPQEEVYLYDWKNLDAFYDIIEQKPGRFIPYSEAITLLPPKEKVSPEFYNMFIACGFPDIDVIHHIRQLSLYESTEDGKLVFAFAGDGFESTHVARFIIDTHDMSYTVANIRKIIPSELAPRWIEQQNIQLIPITNESYQIVRLNDKQQTVLGTLYMVPGQGYAIVLPNGHYAGSPGCESFLGYSDGDKLIGLKALAPWRNRPAEVLEALGGPPDDIAALAATTERWLYKQGLTPANMPKEPALADFASATITLPALKSTTDQLKFEVRLQAARKAITRLEVRADGALIPQEWDKDLLIPAGRQHTVNVCVPLANGQNWIEVTPVDSMGIAGDTQRFRTIHEGEGESALYVIALGVSDYNDDSLNLQYAAKDAQDVVSAFAKYGSGEVKTLLLTNSEVQDISALNKVREFIAGATVNDRVVLYVAGHGVLDDNLEYHFAPAAFSPERVAETGISMDALINSLRSSAARKHLLLLDTCHSGTLGESDMEKLAASGVQLPHGVRAIQNRGMKVKSATSKLGNNVQKKRFVEDLFTTQENTRGMNIIAGTAGSEYAIESSEWQNGIFTAAIVETLRNRIQSDTNSDGFLSVDEFQDCLVRRMNEYTNGTQIPSIVSAEDSVMNISVGRMEWLSSDTVSSEIFWQECTAWAKSGCSVDDANTVLSICVDRSGMTESAFRALLAAGASPSLAAKRIGWSNPALLRIAFEQGATAAEANYIIENHLDCLKQDVTTENIQVLKMAGADFSHSGGLIPYCENADAAKMLISLGADINAKGRLGYTPLHSLMERDENLNGLKDHDKLSIINELLRAGADINIQNDTGRCPGDYDYIQQRAAILQGGSATGNGQTGDRSGLDELIARLAGLKCKNSTSALYQKRLLTLLPLIRNGADVNITLPETKGNTALHYSCGLGSLNITRWLLQNGANPNAVTNKGKTPLECIGSDNRSAIIQELKNYGAR